MNNMDNPTMPHFTVCSSNRLEILSDRLAKIVQRPLSSPIEAETIIVQSHGMERWISLALARRNKICANVWYPFPNTFLETVFRRILPDIPQPSPFEREILTFRILKNLSTILDRPKFTPLRRYLADDDNGLKAYKLSLKLADLYDQYLVFRPELILKWDAGQGDDSPDGRWQAELWRMLASGKENKHRAYLRQEFLTHLATTPAAASKLPSRVSIFGISYLPPFHLQCFVGLSRIVPVHFFLLNPCREFWADILTASEIHRLSKKSESKTGENESLHMEQGHPLLASMGQLGKEFFSLINQYDVHIEDCFEPADDNNLLSRLQSDILNLKDRTTHRFHPNGSADADRFETIHSGTENGAADGSIQIHSCHSPMREIEILHDNLLALFEQDADLKPRDVIVMTPDIGAYAPYISAVFDTREGDAPVIPFAIADQTTRRMSPVICSFLSLLDIPGSRFEASRVLGLLGSAGVKERFGLADAEVETIARWVDHVNIRWGRDTESRKRKGLPGYAENTWMAGIERLLLGYAMPGHDQARMFSGILPYDHIEGGEAQILGRFLEFLNRLFKFSARLENAFSPAAWQSILAELLNSFIAIDEGTERDIQYLHSCLEAFGRLESLAEFSEPLGLEVAKAHIENQIDRNYGDGGFLTGGVTFCAMLPMRSIPFKVVCLIGLGADAFPRDDHPLGFDLIARHSRAGDRSRRKDDKYLFLEALVSARRNLYISYVGQSVQDNSHIPPSVLVSELIENIAQGFGLSESDLVVRHPLQAHSKRYFNEKEPALFSYSRENFVAAAGADEVNAPRPFFAEPLSDPPAECRTLRMEHLCQFFTHPVRYLARHRLRLHLDETEKRSGDKENFNLEALGRYHMKQELLSARLSGHDLRDYFSVQKAKGDLPLGTVGSVLYEKLEQEAEWFAEEISALIGEEPSESVPIDMAVGEFRLQGTLDGLYRQGRIQARFARRRAKDWLSIWIYHLVVCSLEGNRHPRVSTLIDTDGGVRIKPVKHPEAVLRDLLENYLEGLRRPVHFIPELSYDYAKMTGIDGKKPEAALMVVKKQWSGSDYRKGVSEDPYYRLCFGGSDPFDKEFQFLAQKIFMPILAHAEMSG